jgi:molybdopterin molybdotransferase
VKVTHEKTELVAEPIRTSGAGILSSLIHSNGFIIVPEHVEGYEEGELVDVELYRPWETYEN